MRRTRVRFRFIAMVLTLVMVLSIAVPVTVVADEPAPVGIAPPIAQLPSQFSQIFNDVGISHWAFDEIRFVAGRGIMMGTGGGNFSPGANFTRAQVVAVLYRIAGLPDVEFAPVFPDVTAASPDWYRNAAIWANSVGVVEGVGGGEVPVFAGGNNITHEQFAVMLYRFADYLEIGTEFPANYVAEVADYVSDWAVTEFAWASYNALLPIGAAEARLSTTRDQCAVILYNFMTTQLDLYFIINPYGVVNWQNVGRYRAALHVHTDRSDGGIFSEMVKHHYNLGFDILAISDHNVTHPGRWDDGGRSALTSAQASAIMAGTFEGPFPEVGYFGPDLERDPNQGGMIYLPFTNEQSFPNDTNTFWANFNNEPGWTNVDVFEATAAAGGIALINHPGRYTGGAGGGAGGIAASNSPVVISRYMEWLDRFPAVGFEIFNRLDNETRSDRVLWDNILSLRMPYGLPVWGFSNDDSHHLMDIGFNWNVMLLPSLTQENTRTAMETGAFYMVTRVNRNVGPTDHPINNMLAADGPATPISGSMNPLTGRFLTQVTPSINSIEVVGNTIIITGATGTYNFVEWIADGAVIYTGAVFDIEAHTAEIGSNYVRAQLVGDYGMALTQPFGIFAPGERPLTRPVANNLVSIDDLRGVNADLDTEITAEALRLPPAVTVVSNKNWRASVPVTWDVSGISSTAQEAVYTVPGTFSLPFGWMNTDSIALETTVELNIAPIVITPISDIIEMPNTADPDNSFTVEGFVSAAYRTDMVYIQDGSTPWSGIWVTVPGGQIIEDYVGEWVRVTGTRGVQWAQPSVVTTVDNVQVLHGDVRGRPALAEPNIEAFTLVPEPVPAVWNGQWQAMMVTITAQLVERDAGLFQQGTYGQVVFHRLGGVDGLIDPDDEDHSFLILVVDTANFPDYIQDGDWIEISQGLLRWRGGSRAHVLHANMMDGVVTRVDPPA